MNFRKLITALMPALALTQTSCVMVGGYSTSGGWWLWPGSWIISGILLAVFIASLIFGNFWR